jgi:hypothetical protein
MAEVSLEFRQASIETKANQLLHLLGIHVHFVSLVKEDQSPIECAVICRGQTQTIAHIIRTSLGSDRKDVCSINEFQLEACDRALPIIRDSHLTSEIAIPSKTGNSGNDSLAILWEGGNCSVRN